MFIVLSVIALIVGLWAVVCAAAGELRMQTAETVAGHAVIAALIFLVFHLLLFNGA